MIVPVTDRGDAIGLLELVLPAVSLAGGGRRHRERGARARLRRHRGPPAHRRLRMGPAVHARSRWPRRSNGDSSPRPTPARRGSSPSPAGWSRPAPSVGTPSTTPSTGTLSSCRSPTPSATRCRPPCWPPCSSAACATGGGRASTSASRRGTPTTRWPRTRTGQFVTGQLMRVDLHTGAAPDRQCRSPLPAPPAEREGGGGRPAHRAALRCRPGQVFRRPGLPARAGRPDRPAHRRHAGAQRCQSRCCRRPREERRPPPAGGCPRARCGDPARYRR